MLFTTSPHPNKKRWEGELEPTSSIGMDVTRAATCMAINSTWVFDNKPIILSSTPCLSVCVFGMKISFTAANKRPQSVDGCRYLYAPEQGQYLFQTVDACVFGPLRGILTCLSSFYCRLVRFVLCFVQVFQMLCLHWTLRRTQTTLPHSVGEICLANWTQWEIWIIRMLSNRV